MERAHEQITSFSTQRCEFLQYWRGENPSMMMIERRNRKVLARREMVVSGAKVQGSDYESPPPTFEYHPTSDTLRLTIWPKLKSNEARTSSKPTTILVQNLFYLKSESWIKSVRTAIKQREMRSGTEKKADTIKMEMKKG
jgi:hypothetical protein